MSAYQYCRDRQKRWAAKTGLRLIGSREPEAYRLIPPPSRITSSSRYQRILDENLEQGEGDELVAEAARPRYMRSTRLPH